MCNKKEDVSSSNGCLAEQAPAVKAFIELKQTV